MDIRISKIVVFLVFTLITVSYGQEKIQLAKLKYAGGGDWYSNKTALPNLIAFCNQELGMNLAPNEEVVEVGSLEIFQYPFIYMTGHGNVLFSDHDAENLRNYLTAGGFLHIDDNFGMDPFVRLEMKKVFPELEFIEIPYSHLIYNQKFTFRKGLPKIHEHSGQPSQGLGLIYQGRLICFYSYESDLGNGWEDQVIYNDPEALRQKALQMGANLISYSFTIF